VTVVAQQQSDLNNATGVYGRGKKMLEGWEWLIIGVVAIVIIMWGPAKIPEFAKALGRAKGEFNKASKEFNEAALGTESSPVTQTPATQTTIRSRDEMLLSTARNLGISTDGKTKEQITEEISQKVKLLGSNSA
jgi:sec-independent protein translocase protein TatA